MSPNLTFTGKASRTVLCWPPLQPCIAAGGLGFHVPPSSVGHILSEDRTLNQFFLSFLPSISFPCALLLLYWTHTMTVNFIVDRQKPTLSVS